MSDRCVQTSAVYLVGQKAQFMAPPSPPSPRAAARGAAGDDPLCSAVEELSLDGSQADGAAAAAREASQYSMSDASRSARSASPSRTDDTPARQSSPATVPGSPGMGPQSQSQSQSQKQQMKRKQQCKLSSIMAAGLPPLDAQLAGAVHVLTTEAAALQSVASLYASSASARDGFHAAVEAIVHTQAAYPPGKLVVVGVGKSGHIGRKLAATFNSLAVPASFVHPTEALHGDLGHIRPHDALLFITYSGKTQELVSLLPHVDPSLPLILLTAHVTSETCQLIQHRHDAYQQSTTSAAQADAGGPGPLGPTILVPAPIPEEEKVSFGVSAPTTSTTTALAVGDALAIVASKTLHPSVGSVFQRNHPGGAIGAAGRKEPAHDEIRSIAVPWCDIPVVHSRGDVLGADMMRAGYNAASRGWVRLAPGSAGTADSADSAEPAAHAVAPPSRIRKLSTDQLNQPVHAVPGLVVERPDFVIVSADTKTRNAAEWLRAASQRRDGADVVVAVVEPGEGGELVGVLELQDLLQAYGEKV